MAKGNVWRITKSGTNLELSPELNTKERKSEKDTVNIVSFASQFGISVALPVVGGAFLGQFLDKRFNLEPKMTLSFILLGVFLSITNAYFLLKKITKEK